MLKSIGKQSGAIVIDTLDYLCVDGICPAVMPDGNPIYKDKGHIRAFYSKNFEIFIDATVK